MLTNTDFSFDEMTRRYGEAMAYMFLEHIERAAGIASRNMKGVAPQTRLTHAYCLQDIRIQTAQYAAA